MRLPTDFFGAALAFTRVWRSRRRAIAAHGAGANQTTVHLGPHSFYKRCALLLALWFPCPSARMDPAKLRWIGRPGCIWWPGHRRVRGNYFEASERSAAIPHGALAGRYARGNLLCLGARVGQGACIAWSTAVLRPSIEAVSRRARRADAGRLLRDNNCRRIAFIADQRRRMSQYVPVVE